jgi:hypothetical protein
MMPWQYTPMPMPYMRPPMYVPLMMTSSGGFPVPEALNPDDLPPAVREAMMRPLEGPPKPAVSLAVMNQAQQTMVGPDLPWKADA